MANRIAARTNTNRALEVRSTIESVTQSTKRLQPVIWSKGTFLQPQHLQLQDRYLESLLAFRDRTLRLFPYGFTSLRIDHEALAASQLLLVRASGLTPDGLAFDFPESEAAPASRKLDSSFEPIGGETPKFADFYLAIPSYRDGDTNIGREDEPTDARYFAHAQRVRDENSGISERTIQVARKNFRIVAADELRDGLTALPLARVTRDETGVYDLDRSFIPPLLAVSASDPLMDSMRRLLEIIAAKSAILSGLRLTKDRARAHWTVADIENFWLLYTINGALPVLQDVCNQGAVNAGANLHPSELFGELQAFAGALTTFSEMLAPKHLPAYDHDNLGGCFSDLAKKLIQLLEGNGKVNFVSLALRPVQRFIYASSIDDEKYLTNTRLYLAVSAKLPDAELVDRVLRSAKMCSATHMDHLLKHALPGIPLTHVPTPSSIPIKVDYQYFALEQSGAAWQSIERARNIAAFLPEIPAAKAEVIVDFA